MEQQQEAASLGPPLANSVGGDDIQAIARYDAKAEALGNPDIIDIILSFFDPTAFFQDIWKLRSITRRHLLSAALTSKAFRDPALDLLWRMMDSVTPVLKILPSFIKVNDVYTINAPIVQDDVARMKMYSRKVRFIWLNGLQDPIAGHALFRLSHILVEDKLFPALQAISISLPTLQVRNTVENFNSVFLLAGSPSLSTIHVAEVAASTEDFIGSFLSVYSRGPSNIENVTLHGRLSSGSLRLLNRFNHVKNLVLSLQGTTVQSIALLDCGDLSSLEHLVIRLDSSSIFDNTDSVQWETTGGFTALKTLELSGPPPEIAKVLASVAAPSLHTITISFTPSWVIAPWEAVVACIKECGRVSSSLRRFRILAGRGSGVVLPPKSLLPLGNCERLELFELTGVTLSLTDADIEQICETGNWRNLRSLRLPVSPEGHCPSLLGIYTLTKHCPGLRTITLCTDLRLHDHQTLQAEKSIPKSENTLQDLNLLKVAVTERSLTNPNTLMLAIATSRFLEHHFPRMKTIRYASDLAADVGWWEGVRSMIVEYREIRGEMLSSLT